MSNLETTLQANRDAIAAAPKIIVEHPTEPGILEVNTMTGVIVTPPEDRPDWAAGYAVAVMAERFGFYLGRTGQQVAYTEGEVYSALDFSWLAVDMEGTEVSVDADDETRMTILTEMLDIEVADDTGNITVAGSTPRTTKDFDVGVIETDLSVADAAELEELLGKPGFNVEAEPVLKSGTHDE